MKVAAISLMVVVLGVAACGAHDQNAQAGYHGGGSSSSGGGSGYRDQWSGSSAVDSRGNVSVGPSESYSPSNTAGAPPSISG